ncbi:hypothetical protein [Streptomyces sp. NPDC017941]|uniref:hypothetical protein n=1 Tax=Streptomyces sp. NPDC017941 TaxID=3365018 RepID=UPI0037990D67
MWWQSTTGDLWLEIRFDRGRPPTGDEGTLTRVGGDPFDKRLRRLATSFAGTAVSELLAS